MTCTSFSEVCFFLQKMTIIPPLNHMTFKMVIEQTYFKPLSARYASSITSNMEVYNKDHRYNLIINKGFYISKRFDDFVTNEHMCCLCDIYGRKPLLKSLSKKASRNKVAFDSVFKTVCVN